MRTGIRIVIVRMEIKKQFGSDIKKEIVHQFDVFGKKERGLKNASRVLVKGGDAKILNLGQKPRENKSKCTEFIYSLHT